MNNVARSAGVSVETVHAQGTNVAATDRPDERARHAPRLPAPAFTAAAERTPVDDADRVVALRQTLLDHLLHEETEGLPLVQRWRSPQARWPSGTSEPDQSVSTSATPVTRCRANVRSSWRRWSQAVMKPPSTPRGSTTREVDRPCAST
jgi:hypothetical protein